MNFSKENTSPILLYEIKLEKCGIAFKLVFELFLILYQFKEDFKEQDLQLQ